ncbi:nucleotide disphospho-sugar-binding domain-containing protein [Kitasatospora sp. NBC_01302]|uniref:nucleotide disphospho-sugar-binding domain-containing protein n=1 Tax=Kitasatospora sp. NBC_01302 TaxID=2903575 RepID=UPI002E0DE6E2|nr:glycosyltransferase [Kitasatospora sp. NBC_01302]
MTITSWKGFYFSLMPFGWALQAAGHQVRVACAPTEAGTVGAAGLVPLPVLQPFPAMQSERVARVERWAADGRFDGPEELRPLHPVTREPMAHPGEFDIAVDGRRFWDDCVRVIGYNCDAAVGFARTWQPDLVLHDPLAIEGAIAARVVGAPSVYVTPGGFGAVDGPPEQDGDVSFDDPSGACVRHGVRPWDRSQITHVLDPTPDAVPIPLGEATRLRVRHVPYNGIGEAAESVLPPADRPRVCLIWSGLVTEVYGNRAPILRRAVTAITATGAELVVLAPGPEALALLGELPADARVLYQYPLQMALSQCDVLVNSGSINSLMTASTMGVPQLVLPLANDQVEMAARFAKTGAVRIVSGIDGTTEQVKDSLERLLSGSSHREAARRVAEENERRPSPALLVPELERLAAQHK